MTIDEMIRELQAAAKRLGGNSEVVVYDAAREEEIPAAVPGALGGVAYELRYDDEDKKLVIEVA